MCVWLAARERAIECHVGKVHVLAVQINVRGVVLLLIKIVVLYLSPSSRGSQGDGE